MTKSELVTAVAGKHDRVAKKDVEAVVDLVFEALTRALCADERIEIRGLGSLTPRAREAREGRNPKTGELVQVPAKRVPFFTAGKELKKRVNGAYRR